MKLFLLIFFSTLFSAVAQTSVASSTNQTTTHLVNWKDELPRVPNSHENGTRGSSSFQAKTISETASDQISARAQQSAEIRAACIDGRRCVCGRVIKIVPEGLVVESGYTALMNPPFTQSWVIPGGALVSRDAKLFERSEPASPCIGTVLLTDFPGRPAVKLYDYVLLQGYPAGEYLFTPVPGIQKPIRKFAGGLDTAVKLKLEMAKE